MRMSLTTFRHAAIRRGVARTFSVVMMFIIVINIIPGFTWDVIQLKLSLKTHLQKLGLWQGEWPLFAPNPVLNNAWVSADIYQRGQLIETWNSPFWSQVSAREKFVRFRYVNFFNGLAGRDQAVKNDFADYIMRTEIDEPLKSTKVDSTTPEWEVRLFRSKLNLSLTPGEPLPKRDDNIWLTTSERLGVRGYEP